MKLEWPLPKQDYWSTPFAESLLKHLVLTPAGLTLLDIACGPGIPAFYLAEQMGPTGQILAIDIRENQIARARAIQGRKLPWLQFLCLDMRTIPPAFPSFDRITGNLSVMFFRPNRFEVLRGLVDHLNPGGQIVLTFPSLGTFDSIWQRINQEMAKRGLLNEQEKLKSYVSERPSAKDGNNWLSSLGLEQIKVTESPLEIESGPGPEFLYHPLLRGGFLDDAYECFENPQLADDVMRVVSEDLSSLIPLIAQRCVLSGWKPNDRK
ncbi:MAG: class I SAM-dependent methyltransferase [Nitrospirae bacterium]|nr:class I SAM-dependent methyltransferase [Nitrospirota bacterium]